VVVNQKEEEVVLTEKVIPARSQMNTKLNTSLAKMLAKHAHAPEYLYTQ
jgi:hypothetical protein